MVYTEGDPATCFFVLLDGTIALPRRVGADDVEVSRTDQRGVYAGAWSGLPAATGCRRSTTTRCGVTEPSRFFVLAADDFARHDARLVPDGRCTCSRACSSAARTSSRRSPSANGCSPSARCRPGLTHELNNPAAAAVRATSSLRERVAGMRHKLAPDRRRHRATGRPAGDADQAAGGGGRARGQGARAAARWRPRDREDELADWLDDHGIRGGWDIAPTFVQAGLDVEWLDQVDRRSWTTACSKARCAG